MHVESWDTVFVRARRRDVHPLLARPCTYPGWWPGVRRSVHTDCAWLLTPPTATARLAGHRWRVQVETGKVRTDLGVRYRLTGDLQGDAEFWYADEVAGTLVHHIGRLEVPERGWRSRLAAYRALARAGLTELKDRLEGARVPGAEPDPSLLRDQREAAIAYQRGVDSWAARQHAGRER